MAAACGVEDGVDLGEAFVVVLIGEFDDEDAVFRREADEQ